jgi:hypothetical protein
LELSGHQLPESVLSWCAIYHLRFTEPWPETLTRTVLAQDESLATQRRQNLIVTWRRDAEIALDRVAKALTNVPGRGRPNIVASRSATIELRAARALYARGEYAAAYRKANTADNWLTPGTSYRVVASGQLAPYPVWIETTVPVTFTMNEWKRDQIVFDVTSEDNTTIKLRIGDLRPATAYVLTPTGAADKKSRWQLRLARRGENGAMSHWLSDGSGTIEASFRVVRHAESAADLVVRGTYRSIFEKAPLVFGMFRDDGKGTERVAVNDDTAILRGEVGKAVPVSLEQLQYGDDVTVLYGADHVAKSVTAHTRVLTGTVEEIGQMEPHSMPFVQLRGSDMRHVIDLNAPLLVPDRNAGGAAATTTFRTAQPGSVAVNPGDEVTLRLHPRTGRVFELRNNSLPVP